MIVHYLKVVVTTGCTCKARLYQPGSGVTSILIQRFLFKEVLTQFVSLFIIISAVVSVSQITKIVDRLTDFGVSLENFLLPFLFTLIPYFNLIIPLAFLFATLVTFARLSADGEMVALLATGSSFWKLARPVILCAVLLSVVGSISSLYLEPWAQRSLRNFTYEKAQSQLDNFIEVRMKPGVFIDGFLGYVFYTETMNQDKSDMQNILIAPGKSRRDQKFSIYAPKGSLQGSVSQGNLTLNLLNGTIYTYQKNNDHLSVLKFDNMQLDLLRLFKQRILKNRKLNKEYETLNPSELKSYITGARGEWLQSQAEGVDPKKKVNKLRSRYFKAHYLLYQRYANSFLAIAFGLLGMLLGIQDQRRNNARTYRGLIVTIVLSYTLLMTCKRLGQSGILHAGLVSWISPSVLTMIAIMLLLRRQRRPLSESLF